MTKQGLHEAAPRCHTKAGSKANGPGRPTLAGTAVDFAAPKPRLKLRRCGAQTAEEGCPQANNYSREPRSRLLKGDHTAIASDILWYDGLAFLEGVLTVAYGIEQMSHTQLACAYEHICICTQH